MILRAHYLISIWCSPAPASGTCIHTGHQCNWHPWHVGKHVYTRGCRGLHHGMEFPLIALQLPMANLKISSITHQYKFFCTIEKKKKIERERERDPIVAFHVFLGIDSKHLILYKICRIKLNTQTNPYQMKWTIGLQSKPTLVKLSPYCWQCGY